MSCLEVFRLIAIQLVSISLLTVPAFSQDKQKSQTPDTKPRKVKSEPPTAYQRWEKEDVDLIITPAEREAFDKLTTDDEREQFIKEFWSRRDPDPDTEENEFKEEHFERIAYANERFASGKPGRMTDRGRIYIKFGKPDSIESYAAGGTYHRLPHEGSGTTSVYPFERWFYRHIPGVRSGVEIEFVDPTGSGEYRIARSLNEKDALLYVPGAGQTLDELAGRESRADRIAGNTYRREQDSQFAMIDLLKDLDKAPELKSRLDSGILTGTPKVDDNPLDFEIHAHYFRQSDNSVLTALNIQTDNRELSFQNSGGLQTAHLNILGRITTVADRRVGVFEDSVTTTATNEELTEARERKSVYAKAVILQPGHYRVDVLVRDIVSGATGVRHFTFKVPTFEANKLSTSSLILATRLESVERPGATERFVIGTTKVIPNLSAAFRKGQSVGVYLQIYNAGIDQTTLRPAVDVEYVLLQSGKELRKQSEDWSNISDSGQRLTLTRLIPTDGLVSGEYEIMVRIKDKVTGQALSPVAKFRIM